MQNVSHTGDSRYANVLNSDNTALPEIKVRLISKFKIRPTIFTIYFVKKCHHTTIEIDEEASVLPSKKF